MTAEVGGGRECHGGAVWGAGPVVSIRRQAAAWPFSGDGGPLSSPPRPQTRGRPHATAVYRRVLIASESGAGGADWQRHSAPYTGHIGREWHAGRGQTQSTLHTAGPGRAGSLLYRLHRRGRLAVARELEAQAAGLSARGTARRGQRRRDTLIADLAARGTEAAPRCPLATLRRHTAELHPQAAHYVIK